MPDEILSQRELRRYSRQIMIPEIGTSGQEKLKKAKILVVGAGGLGSPVLQYLTAAGIGKLGIAEFDLVSETNLQRQILYGADDVGKLKSIIAKSRLEQLNSLVEISIINLRIESLNASGVFKDYDVIVDATDNLEARYTINDTCVLLSKPMVHGAIYKFEAQVSVFNFNGGPTYRCYNPEPGEKKSRDPLASEVGVTGVLPGIAGTLMANEVIKIVTGAGNVLSGKMLLFNIFENTFRIFSVKNNQADHLI
jgi:sulfur-carrier protein adenylyltransferase/sulfurtransferase